MINFFFLFLALVSEILGTVGGFGSSVFFVPLAGLFFNFKTVLVVTGILHVFSNTAKLLFFYKGINRRLLLLIGIPSVVFVLLGAYLSVHLFSTYTEFALGIFLVTFGIFFLLYPKAKVSQSKLNAISGGSVAGFFAGLIGTGGAIRGLSLAAFDLEKNAFIATSAAIDFCVDLSRTTVYLSNTYLEKTYYTYIPFLLLIAFVGSYTGKLLLKNVSQDNFRKIVLVMIILIGILMILKLSMGWSV